ncbi:hypothetical protein CCAX7_48250 [Capsulimonas corticalis]|uniref:Uncharacterized protein n=1 Tax=Capsulimonas corticalis TaxID=2219043 RepID=A0A402CQA9_9BACT|nr:alpha/beta hydrolase [Capsulimonas corticalis]BDI32774.1 hypothetical protein CCAX7_48250 [Capsulimonas corticalis]
MSETTLTSQAADLENSVDPDPRLSAPIALQPGAPGSGALPPSPWKGTRLVASPAALKAPAATDYSFMITNRYNINNDNTPYNPFQPATSPVNQVYPLANGNLWWALSQDQANDPNASDFQMQSPTPSTTPPNSFQQAIVTNLQAQSQQYGSSQLTLFIHGLGNLWVDAVAGTSALGANLANSSYTGLVVGFDWPSYDEYWSGLYYSSDSYAFPPAGTQGTIRDNINGSSQAFGNVLSFMQGLRSTNGISNLTLNIVCHSEGNYMDMVGMLSVSGVQIDHVLMLAADINNGAFQIPATGLVGQGSQISQTDPSAVVTVYFSNNDDVLASSQAAYQGNNPIYDDKNVHNPAYGGRMGQTGPAYNIGQQQPNVYSLDCSGVLTPQYIAQLEANGVIPNGATLHSSYLYVPQLGADIAQALDGVAPGSITGRSQGANPNAYYLNPT